MSNAVLRNIRAEITQLATDNTSGPGHCHVRLSSNPADDIVVVNDFGLAWKFRQLLRAHDYPAATVWVDCRDDCVRGVVRRMLPCSSS